MRANFRIQPQTSVKLDTGGEANKRRAGFLDIMSASGGHFLR